MRMNLQHTHQSTAQRSVYSHTLACSLHTSLQHAHQPTAHASVYSICISLQHTHQSAAYTSVCSIRISLRHRYQPVAHTSVCSPRISLQHMHHSIASHQPAAYASVYSRTSIYSTHICLQPAHQFTTYVSVCFRNTHIPLWL